LLLWTLHCSDLVTVGSAVTGHTTGTHNGGVVQQVENAVTGHGTHGTHTTGTGLGNTTGTTGLGTNGTGLGHTTGTTGLGTTGHHTGVVGEVENAVTGHGTHGTHAHGTHGTHSSGPAGLIAKAKLKVTGHT
jgi:hypothetical protein